MRRALTVLSLLIPLAASAAPEPADLEAALSPSAVGAVQVRGDFVLGRFPVEATEPVEAAQRFLATHADLLGLPQLSWLTSREGRLGTYVRFQQELDGLPVFDGQVVVRVAETSSGFVVTAVNRDAPLLPAAAPAPLLSADDALQLVLAELGAPADRVPPTTALGLQGGALVYRVRLGTGAPVGSWEAFVDARTGQLRSLRDVRVHVDGTGQVFDPNPVASSGNTALTDSGDSDTVDLQAEYQAVVLPRLDGTGVLAGDFVDADRPGRANEPTLDFTYDRSDNAFEEVMTYFHIDRTQDRIQTALGIIDANNRQQLVNVNGTNQDNSWYDPWTLEITTGTGGVDDSEDGDILVHEYGHAIQDDQVPGWGSSNDGGAMGEGFGDYLAASFADTLTAQLADPACVGDWDAVSYAPGPVPCLRRVDEAVHYPHDLGPGWDVHGNGELWSAMLWDARARVGADVMDTVVLEHHFLQTPTTTFGDATIALQDTADLLYPGTEAEDIRRALIWYGFSNDITAPGVFSTVVNTVAVLYYPPRSAKQYLNDEDWLMVHTEPGADGIRAHLFAYDIAANDHLYVYDGDGNLYEVLTAGMALDHWTPDIPGDTIQIRFVSDGSGKARGLKIDEIETLAP